MKTEAPDGDENEKEIDGSGKAKDGMLEEEARALTADEKLG